MAIEFPGTHREIPQRYFPSGVGPGGFDIELMRAAATRINEAPFIHEVPMKSWVVLYLLDRLEDAERLEQAHGIVEIRAGKCGSCMWSNLKAVDHPSNEVDWNGPGSSQRYQVYRCKRCDDYWGCRHQYDSGTGADDHWHRFGNVNPDAIKRHY